MYLPSMDYEQDKKRIVFFKNEDFDKIGVFHICLSAENLIDGILLEIHTLSSSFEAEDFDKNKLYPI